MLAARLFSLFGLYYLATAKPCQICTFENIIPSGTLQWCPCYSNFSCTRLDVPLDYHRPDVGRASVPLIRLSAKTNSTSGPYQGMMLINPGGPGVSGVDFALEQANAIQVGTWRH
ncbi:hypothetical protein PG984_004410 [Apiospora sp. TS-2023a]